MKLLLNRGLVIADWYSRLGALGLVFVLIGITIAVGVSLWNHRP